ncbi:NUDIX domain-containing protein [Nocardiopsis suaedae]|uniref:NUDIX hydrolase n=1 Tax=Nocardiopsis suaedae TaxID=3018444 RepID=A0ABT4TLI3_9ACTN|nr:NUDIX hydrolase [Nocardiopsis suaedae]MDA2805553.1 NUDIX hydrolase [Nocardiopsis suaedae]
MGAHHGGKPADVPDRRDPLAREVPFRGAKTRVHVDRLALPGADGPEEVSREYLVHPGAAAALALDEAGRVLMVHQYRHAVGERLWELPAGVRDEEGEAPVRTAMRELEEEAGHRAERWFELADFYPSPGFSSERIQVFLGRGVSPVPEAEQTFVRLHEEADLHPEWVPLEEAVRAVSEARVRNGATVVGVLAAAAAERDGFASLRPAE